MAHRRPWLPSRPYRKVLNEVADNLLWLTVCCNDRTAKPTLNAPVDIVCGFGETGLAVPQRMSMKREGEADRSAEVIDL